MSTDLVVQGTELVPSGTLFGTDSPDEVVQRASAVAKTLEQVVRSQGLVVQIGKGEHVKVEGWTFLGSMLGVFPVVTWTRPVMVDDIKVGWEARVEARTRAGEVVGAAEAECLQEESLWKGRDDYARKSMAQTRAVSKALRQPLGFVMKLAGFNPTPAEEMPVIEGSAREPSAGAPVPQDVESRPASRVDDPAAGTPFSDDPTEPLEESGTKPRYISERQRTRLFTIASNSGVQEEDVRDIVREVTGQESTKLIPVGRVYEAVIAAIQARAA